MSARWISKIEYRKLFQRFQIQMKMKPFTYKYYNYNSQNTDFKEIYFQLTLPHFHFNKRRSHDFCYIILCFVFNYVQMLFTSQLILIKT
jgi:hypothetical protein